MQRRDFLKLSGSAWLLSALPAAMAASQPTGSAWRKYRLTYEIDLREIDSRHPGSEARLWLPMPESRADYQQADAPQWQGNAIEAGFTRVDGVPVFQARWQGNGERKLSVTVDVATRDRSGAISPDDAEVARFLQPSASMPLDGIVRDTAQAATRNAATPAAKARAIYDWVVDNTFREPTVQGCGRGDIKAMLESGNLGGKCADINALFVGLCRAAGIPAREVYGIRVDDSSLFKSLGRSGDISRAQHCRAEFWLENAGWIPVDAADVRKAVLEEKLPLDDVRINTLRERLFGHWEMNWVAYNHARDLTLPPAHRTAFFMYPCAEVDGTACNSLDPAGFAYRIQAQAL